MGVILSIMLYGIMPFDDTNTKRLIKDQKARKISINKNIKMKLSSECLSIHSLCLEPEASNRVNIKELLSQPWLKKQVEKHRWDADW